MERRLAIFLCLWCIGAAMIPTLACAETQRSSDYYNNQGMRFAKAGDFDSAIDNFSKALAIEPDNVFAYLNLGIVHKRRKEYDLAIAYLNKALELDQNFQDAYTVLVDIYTLLGDFDRATDYSFKALSLNRDNPTSLYNAGYAYLLEGDQQEAMAQYVRLKELRQQELADKLLKKINERYAK
ncbi:MAG: tetratricopeptide repeat protein [Candidatus Omnitrophica bacterium]|nr:tetratricopeptide repeat protein [Candidatus Omnitrophota bacterium]